MDLRAFRGKNHLVSDWIWVNVVTEVVLIPSFQPEYVGGELWHGLRKGTQT